MSRSEGFEAQGPVDEDPRQLFAISPFTRLARSHVFSTAGDALFTIGLAGTVFFDVDLDEARWKVALTLLLTIAPLAVAAPLIGPALDRIRGGRLWMIVGTCVGRSLVSFLLIQQFDSLFFYPLAFVMLVLGKSYQVAKSAMVPTTVRNDAELVEANSKLSLLSGLSVAVAAVPGGLFWWLGGPEWVVGFAGVVFAGGAVAAVRLPSTQVAEEPATESERAELRSLGIVLAASAMGLLRAVVGFLAFLLAFDYKGEGAWKLGVIAGAAQVGFLVGAAIAPRLRKVVEEEHILIGVLLTILVTSVGAAFTGGLGVASVMSFMVGAGSSAGKQAFDAIVQRDAPDANRGRSFARFETRFQLLWVVGALVPVVITLPMVLGFLVIAGVAGFAAASYWLGLRSAAARASGIVHRQRRVARVEATEDVARDLGFEHGMVEEDESSSAAARAANRRRRRRRRQAAPSSPEPDAGGELETAPEEGPNLDWNPQL